MFEDVRLRPALGRAGALSNEASRYKSLADARGGIQKAKELVSDARGVAGPSFA